MGSNYRALKFFLSQRWDGEKFCPSKIWGKFSPPKIRGENFPQIWRKKKHCFNVNVVIWRHEPSRSFCFFVKLSLIHIVQQHWRYLQVFTVQGDKSLVSDFYLAFSSRSTAFWSWNIWNFPMITLWCSLIGMKVWVRKCSKKSIFQKKTLIFNTLSTSGLRKRLRHA